MEDFYPAIENHGLVQEFSTATINAVVGEVGHWYQSISLSSPLFCSFNITSHQLLSDALANNIKMAFARTRIPPSSLKIEITEKIAAANPEKTIHTLNLFRSMGVGIFLDHFGVGYTTLSYLDDLPCEIIKVDRSFLYKSRGEEKPTLLHAIATLAHDLKMQVIAEGIESEDDAQRAKACGCTYGQGFAFGRPLSIGETRTLIGVSLA
jgi:EAL domain-containing protein (putative c-di-GMP-specific phosphodiesterase class I)